MGGGYCWYTDIFFFFFFFLFNLFIYLFIYFFLVWLLYRILFWGKYKNVLDARAQPMKQTKFRVLPPHPPPPPPPPHTHHQPASVAQLDAPSDWRPGGRGFNPRQGRQHSFVEIDHEIFSTVILSLPLIQEGQLSVSGERMCTILVNRLED